MVQNDTKKALVCTEKLKDIQRAKSPFAGLCCLYQFIHKHRKYKIYDANKQIDINNKPKPLHLVNDFREAAQ